MVKKSKVVKELVNKSRTTKEFEKQIKETEVVIKKAKKLDRPESIVRLSMRKEELERKKERSIRTTKGLVKAGKIIERILSPKLPKEKILRKPTVKLPSASPTKFIAQLAQSQGQLVREVPDRFSDPPQDNRSLFFREAFAEEKRKAFGGFL